MNGGKRLGEGVSSARVLKRNAYKISQDDVDVKEEEESSVRRGRTAKWLLLSRLVTLVVMNSVGWLTLGRRKACEAYGVMEVDMTEQWMWSVLRHYESVALISMIMIMTMRMGTRPRAFVRSTIFSWIPATARI